MKVLSEAEIRKKFSENLKHTDENFGTEAEEQADPKKRLKNYCIKLLVRRDYSEQELFYKAKTKGFDLQFFPEVIKELQEDNFQSDLRFCEAFVNSRIQKQMGPVKIKMELKQKGVQETVYTKVFSDLSIDWESIALAVLQKKYKPLAEHADFQEKQKAKAKLMRFLQSRGFESEAINFALKELGV